MNAGRDYKKARAQAQANANLTQTPRVLIGYNGMWWIDHYDPTRPLGQGAEKINPESDQKRNGAVNQSKVCTDTERK